MELLRLILLLLLLVCATATALSKRLILTLIIYMAYSLVMALTWVLLESPDLAITEAAVGAGVTSILFFITLRRIHHLKEEEDQKDG